MALLWVVPSPWTCSAIGLAQELSYLIHNYESFDTFSLKCLEVILKSPYDRLRSKKGPLKPLSYIGLIWLFILIKDLYLSYVWLGQYIEEWNPTRHVI